MSTFNDYPEGSILSEMRLDVYANRETGEITMFYEGEFYKKLTLLEFAPKSGEMTFVFDGKLRVPLGGLLDGELGKHIAKAKQVAAYQVTLEGRPGAAYMVPLKIINA